MRIFSFFGAALVLPFSLLAADKFGMDAAGTGRLLSFVGALSLLGSVVLVPATAARIGTVFP
jgi:hypothetical protein